MLVVAVAAAALLIVHRRGHSRPPAEAVAGTDPLLAVPAGAELIVTADVAELARVAASDLTQAGGARLLGLRELCGFEPLLELRRVAFSMPGPAGGEPGSDFAFIAESSLRPEPALRCAEALIRRRGGKPVRSRVGQFTSVRDQAKPSGELAIRSDGLFVLSGGRYFRDVVDAASGAGGPSDEAAGLRSRLHAGLRGKLSPSQLIVTLLPRAQSLPGVQAVGLGLEIGAQITLRGFVGCRSSRDCEAAGQAVDDARGALRTEAGLSGLESLTLQQRGQELELRARLPRAELLPLLSQLAAW